MTTRRKNTLLRRLAGLAGYSASRCHARGWWRLDRIDGRARHRAIEADIERLARWLLVELAAAESA